MADPKVGDRALLYPEGCLPSPVTVTAVKNGAITAVRPGGGWLSFGPDQYVIDQEDWTPEDWKTCTILFDRG